MMNTITRRLLLVGLAALALAACGTTSPMQQVTSLPPPLAIDVGKIEIVSNFQGSQQPPHVEALFPVPPEQAMRDWAKTRLVAVGHSGVARFTIVDASVIKADLNKDAGLPGIPRAPQTILYDATSAAFLDILDDQGNRKGQASARVQFSRTIWPDASPEAHQQLREGMIAPLMKTFDAEMAANMRTYLSAYLK